MTVVVQGEPIYLLEDLANDLITYYEKYRRRTVDYDELVIWIYHRHRKRISLNTIITKLSRARRRGLITITYRKRDFNGYWLRDKARVIINVLSCKALILTTRTITLRRFMSWG